MKSMKVPPSASTGSDSAHPASRTRKPTAMLGGLCLAALVIGESALAAPTVSPFQRYINQSCTNSVCAIYFNSTTVAPGTRLDIDNVSCYLKSSGEMDRLELVVLTLPAAVAGSATLVPIPTNPPTLIGGTYIYAVNDTVSMTARAGQGFIIVAETTGKFSTVACQISGQLLEF